MEEYEDILSLDISSLGYHGFKKIHSAFYDMSDHFNIIIECTDSSIITEKIIIQEGRLTIEPHRLSR